MNGQEASISVSSSGNFSNDNFEISIGDNGNILSSHLDFNGQSLSMMWEFTNLSPGIYPVRIKQTNYVFGTPYPEFNFTITLPYGTLDPIVPVAKINDEKNGIDYTFLLQVNP